MELWMFIGALVAVYLVPGPDMVLVLQTGVAPLSWTGFRLVLKRGSGLHWLVKYT